LFTAEEQATVSRLLAVDGAPCTGYAERDEGSDTSHILISPGADASRDTRALTVHEVCHAVTHTSAGFVLPPAAWHGPDWSACNTAHLAPSQS
jgi:hypothetical protein